MKVDCYSTYNRKTGRMGLVASLTLPTNDIGEGMNLAKTFAEKLNEKPCFKPSRIRFIRIGNIVNRINRPADLS